MWSARFVDSYGRRVASARIALVKPEGPISNGLYNVIVFIADPDGPISITVPPETVVGTLIDAEQTAERKVSSRTSVVRCNGWHLESGESAPIIDRVAISVAGRRESTLGARPFRGVGPEAFGDCGRWRRCLHDLEQLNLEDQRRAPGDRWVATVTRRLATIPIGDARRAKEAGTCPRPSSSEVPPSNRG